LRTQDCSKCGDLVKPQWHASCVDVDKSDKLIYVNCSEYEHLHYICRCGYDWIINITKEDLVEDN
jgi:hypothetical protein